MVSIFSTRAVKIGPNISLNDKAVQKFEIAPKTMFKSCETNCS